MPRATDLQIIQTPIDDLRPDPANPRRISDAELDTLTKSMRVHGFVLPILARLEDHVVIGGHQRLIAARRLGHKTVPTIFLDMDLDQARVLNLALNKISGEWDQELLGQLLKDLATDPPYLVDYTAGHHPPSKANKPSTRNKNWDEYQDPESSIDFFVGFLQLGLQHLKPNSAVYMWHATRRQALVEQAWQQCGLLVHQTIVWVKTKPKPG
jgi:hypothetical protein